MDSIFPELELVRIARETEPLGLGFPVHYARELSSTNDAAKHGAKEGAPHGALWIADAQTHGRGRQGRTWTSPPGENLMFSLLLRPRRAARFISGLPIAVGVAVHGALSETLGGVTLKWPNDLLVHGKKIAGILVEATSRGGDVDALVVGIGINVHSREFPEGIRATSVALESTEETRATLSRTHVLLRVLTALQAVLPRTLEHGIAFLESRIAQIDALTGHQVVSTHGAAGIAQGIDAEGNLKVLEDDGIVRRWSSGEVHLGPRPDSL